MAPYLVPVSMVVAALAALPAGLAQNGTWSNPATGGLWSGASNWTGSVNLSGNNTYAGVTNVNGGILSLNSGGIINAGAFNTANVAGARLIVNGGTLTSGGLSTFNQTGGGFLLTSGTAAFNAGVRTANSDAASSGSMAARSPRTPWNCDGPKATSHC